MRGNLAHLLRQVIVVALSKGVELLRPVNRQDSDSAAIVETDDRVLIL